MAEYYKSRYLAEPIIYIQEEDCYSTVQPNGDRVTIAGRVPDEILRSLEPMPAEDAQRLIATSYHQSRRVELSPFHQVFSYTSPAPLVTRACVEAVRRMGWKAHFEGSAVLIADEDIAWWKTGWKGYPRTLKLTIREADGETFLDFDHLDNSMRYQRRPVGRIIEQLATLIDELLKDAGNELPAKSA